MESLVRRMSWRIVIPSYHRQDTIGKNTLRVLKEHGIPDDRITVYVAPDEIDAYKGAIGGVSLKESVKGCIQNRQFIRDSFPSGTHLIFIDDDIQRIATICDLSDDHKTCNRMSHTNNKSPDYIKQIPVSDLTKFFNQAFDTMIEEGANLGGIYPCNNGFFARHRYTTDLRYICGGFFFEINQPDRKLSGLEYAEDFERTLQFFVADGKVVRFEYLFVKTPYYTGTGGLVETRTIENSKQAQERVAQLYPGLCSVVAPTKNNQFWNLKLHRNTRKD